MKAEASDAGYKDDFRGLVVLCTLLCARGRQGAQGYTPSSPPHDTNRWDMTHHSGHCHPLQTRPLRSFTEFLVSPPLSKFALEIVPNLTFKVQDVLCFITSPWAPDSRVTGGWWSTAHVS